MIREELIAVITMWIEGEFPPEDFDEMEALVTTLESDVPLTSKQINLCIEEINSWWDKDWVASSRKATRLLHNQMIEWGELIPMTDEFYNSLVVYGCKKSDLIECTRKGVRYSWKSEQTV